MWKLLRKLLGIETDLERVERLQREELEPREGDLITHNMDTGEEVPTRTTDKGKLFTQITSTNKCPDCGVEGFFEGPSGGMSTNIVCSNEADPHWFNITPMSYDGQQGIAERIKR